MLAIVSKCLSATPLWESSVNIGIVKASPAEVESSEGLTWILDAPCGVTVVLNKVIASTFGVICFMTNGSNWTQLCQIAIQGVIELVPRCGCGPAFVAGTASTSS